MNIDTILFDLDGTLIDTEPSAARAVFDCFSEWGLPIIGEDTTYVTGRTWASAFDYLFGKYPPPMPRDQAVEHVMKKYRQTLAERLDHVPGSVAAVRSLAKNYRLGLVSGSGRSEILWALDQLKILPHFEIILGAEDYPRSKPAPDGYLKAMQILGSEQARTLIFEDSLAGIQSARAAGAWVIAVTSTNHFNQDVSAAHHQIADLTPVTADWVAKLSLQVKL
jgi:HAD superfamily hydrolase (TIGR01509 family)